MTTPNAIRTRFAGSAAVADVHDLHDEVYILAKGSVADKGTKATKNSGEVDYQSITLQTLTIVDPASKSFAQIQDMVLRAEEEQSGNLRLVDTDGDEINLEQATTDSIEDWDNS